jgi:hypothetical protein
LQVFLKERLLEYDEQEKVYKIHPGHYNSYKSILQWLKCWSLLSRDRGVM